jgi:AcrR family transcriptional regulator
MTPRAADPAIRTALLDAAARVLVEEGPAALTTRRLAQEVGASTMAVYTYFSGMEELKRELRREGFARLAALQEATAPTGDVVADVVAQGIAYFTNALANPHLYRFMFMDPMAEEEEEVARDTFDRLLAAVKRAIDAGRFHGDPERLATQLWAMAHGIVSLEHAGCLTLEEGRQAAQDMAENLLVGFGEDPATARAIIERAREAYEAQGVEVP